MSNSLYPTYDPEAAANTRDALHAYARVMGDCLKAARRKRKHWWHASLRPSLNGLTTGIVRGTLDFELDLDIQNADMCGHSSSGASLDLSLCGQTATEVADEIAGFMIANNVPEVALQQFLAVERHADFFSDFSTQQAAVLQRILASVASVMERFRAGIREETSPVQLWPHHFDLSMIWLPGEKIPGQDPMNEEYSDKQMNFGFTFGDENITEPYFYVTAYPTPDAFAELGLPDGTEWMTDGFTGAVVPYRYVAESSDPDGYLLDLWTVLLTAGRHYMVDKEHGGAG